MWEPKCWLWLKFEEHQEKIIQFKTVLIHLPKDQCRKPKINRLQASVHDADNSEISRSIDKKIRNLSDIHASKTGQIQINDQKIKGKY